MKQQEKQIPEWRQLELLIASIQKRLAPEATVTHNVQIQGRQSETTRQIDVLVEQNIGPYSIRIVIDCKDYSSPIDVKGVEEFHGLMVDVGANKGALVCPVGFTKAAKNRAKKMDIDLFSPVDTDPHKWQASPTIPAICDFRSARMRIQLSCMEPVPLRIPEKFYELPMYDPSGKMLGIIASVAEERWDAGEYPIEPGIHPDIPLFGSVQTTIDNGYGKQVKVELTVFLDVKRERYFGHVQVTDLHGLRDEISGRIITNAFKVKILSPQKVVAHWTKLKEDEDPPTPSGLHFQGLHCLGIRA